MNLCKYCRLLARDRDRYERAALNALNDRDLYRSMAEWLADRCSRLTNYYGDNDRTDWLEVAEEAASPLAERGLGEVETTPIGDGMYRHTWTLTNTAEEAVSPNGESEVRDE